MIFVTRSSIIIIRTNGISLGGFSKELCYYVGMFFCFFFVNYVSEPENIECESLLVKHAQTLTVPVSFLYLIACFS